MAKLDLGKVVGDKGDDAKINGVNTLTLNAGRNISLNQDGSTTTIGFSNEDNFVNVNTNNLTNYELKTNTGAIIELSINSSTYVMTLNLKNSAGTVISSDTLDLPLESVVVGGSYDSTNKKIVLTLESGSTIDVPVGDLVSGLQSEITSNNKLASDLVDDTNQAHKFVSASEKETWNAKSDFSGSYNDLSNKPTIPDELADLSDDSTHRLVTDTEKASWDAKGSYSKPSGGIPKTDLAEAVQTSLEKADTALQSETYTGTITGITMNGTSKGTSGVVDLGTVITEHQDISGKENTSNKVSTIDVNSTNTQYAGAKAVYDYVGTVVGDIESLLANINSGNIPNGGGVSL